MLLLIVSFFQDTKEVQWEENIQNAGRFYTKEKMTSWQQPDCLFLQKGKKKNNPKIGKLNCRIAGTESVKAQKNLGEKTLPKEL